MKDIQSIIEVMKDAMLQKLGEEVDLIFQYGSHIRGNTHKFSDVDLSFVPVHESTWENITVMVDDKLFDFYPMRWSLLERMAGFKDVSSSVLLNHRVIYQRNEQVAARLQSLVAKLHSLQQPEARAMMIRQAQQLFQAATHDFYLLQLQVEEHNAAGCIKQSQAIFRTLLHSLAVCNQACIDTRKMEQVLALPKLPDGFSETAGRLIAATRPGEILDATRTLLNTTRALLLSEQRQHMRAEADFASVFDAGYPELKRDIQAVMMACEQQDMLSLKNSLISLLHEMSCGIAQVNEGISYSGFNGLSEYEQNLAAFGFPSLLPYLCSADFQGLYQQCICFDERLREFLTERSVALNAFPGVDELKEYLQQNFS